MIVMKKLDKQGLIPKIGGFLREIVAIPSGSGGEGAVLERIRGEMEMVGWEDIHLDRVGNLRGKIGTGRLSLVIDGHADTVGPGRREEWECDPYRGMVKDGWIWGRGTVDQKGGVASAVYAGSLFKQFGPADDLTLHLVISVQEENCEGLSWEHIIAEEGFHPDAVILTEPSSLEIRRGQLGHMDIVVEAAGRSAHAFCPEEGKNAVYEMMGLIDKLRLSAPSLASHPAFGRGVITVTDIRSESASDNSVPDLCRIRIDRRFCPQETEDELIAEIRRWAGDSILEIKVPVYRQKSHTGVLLEGKKYFPGWLLDEEDPLVAAARETTAAIRGEEAPVGTWRFSTNGISTMGRHGIPTIGFGPGREEMAHRPNERVRIEDLTEACLFYAYLPGKYVQELSAFGANVEK